ncbi:DoxX family protein [Sphingomonas parva]|uniref:DoxX family protein n=1 Tax=Sphingomonas parva TaxID=2555898 RepID=A0A4Y8ZP54_9SPHN|nr:DoxX family protein [Sphingomonas parva]TFI57793.1 DoxX family protein [Sphingomonas parva]
MATRSATPAGPGPIAADRRPGATASVRTGRILSALFALFMLGASIAPKLMGMPVAGETLEALGWPARHALAIGLLELALLALYLFPRTSLLGAVLMTALLGGAIAAHVRAGSPLLSHTLFGIYLALFMWGGLWLRSPALRALFPIVRERN